MPSQLRATHEQAGWPFSPEIVPLRGGGNPVECIQPVKNVSAKVPGEGILGIARCGNEIDYRHHVCIAAVRVVTYCLSSERRELMQDGLIAAFRASVEASPSRVDLEVPMQEEWQP
jgi:hypothetical protein